MRGLEAFRSSDIWLCQRRSDGIQLFIYSFTESNPLRFHSFGVDTLGRLTRSLGESRGLRVLRPDWAFKVRFLDRTSTILESHSRRPEVQLMPKFCLSKVSGPGIINMMLRMKTWNVNHESWTFEPDKKFINIFSFLMHFSYALQCYAWKDQRLS